MLIGRFKAKRFFVLIEQGVDSLPRYTGSGRQRGLDTNDLILVVLDHRGSVLHGAHTLGQQVCHFLRDIALAV